MRSFAILGVLAVCGCSATSPGARIGQEAPATPPAPSGDAKDDAKSDAKDEAPPKRDVWHGHLPIGFANTGICFGNSKDWNGLRFNWSDDDLGTINGINTTLWAAAGGDATGDVNGIGIGLISNIAENLRGVTVALGVNAAESDMKGVHVAGFLNGSGKELTGVGGALFVNGAGRSMTGVHVAGLVNGCGGDLRGVNAALLVNGSGGDVCGVSLAGLVGGSGGSVDGVNVAGLVGGCGGSATGVTAAGFVSGAGQDVTGLTLAGITAGAGRDATGITVALGSAGAGRTMHGISLALGFLEAGGHTKELDEALEKMQSDIEKSVEQGEKVDATDVTDKIEEAQKRGELGEADPGTIAGIAVTGLRARAGSMRGVVAALGHLNAKDFKGLGISLCTRIEKAQTGVTFGAFNHAETIDGFGFQLGLINHIPTNPSWARWLPLINWQM
ncbi:MAG: hypothetical protein JNL94_08425 [Planctomycetes bacterium]|nr:hypothetical protein [Planctomycetota bacterium]